MFAARQVALAGFDVFLFNRDIKPGGLAEYGIYPIKDKMKFGLRKQFAQVLNLPNMHYFGHVQVGDGYEVTLSDLDAMRPAAIIFACGAQGAGKLGLPEEDAKGVYAAKDFVYHYNQLPPYASMDFSTGKKVAIIGQGNVAIDISRWLLRDGPNRKTENVLVIARRGPFEIKADQKEIAYTDQHISRDELTAELARIKERCAVCGQDVSPEKIFELHFRHLLDPEFASVEPRLSFRFLSSPTAILKDANGRISQIEVAENDLVLRNGSTVAVPTKDRVILDVDTLIFAIGDKHDVRLGLPMGPDGYATEPDPAQPNEPHFEVWNPESGRVIQGLYVVGWARRASTGLVGIARHDGEVGASKAIEYVKNAPDSGTMSEMEILAELRKMGQRVVTKADLALLGSVEEREAKQRNLTSFKFSDDEVMFKAIAEAKEQMKAGRSEESDLLPAS
jgi:ferredoxin--NADP+ reductase